LQQKENYVNAGKLFRPQPGNFHRAFSANQFQLPGHWPEAFSTEPLDGRAWQAMAYNNN